MPPLCSQSEVLGDSLCESLSSEEEESVSALTPPYEVFAHDGGSDPTVSSLSDSSELEWTSSSEKPVNVFVNHTGNLMLTRSFSVLLIFLMA